MNLLTFELHPFLSALVAKIGYGMVCARPEELPALACTQFSLRLHGVG